MWMIFWVIVLVAVDQALKFIVSSSVKFSGEVALIPHLLDITYVENRGAAFGILQNQRWLFVAFAVVIISLFIYLIKRKKIVNKMFLLSAVLIIAGGVGNFIDRLVLGYVVDYIKLSFFSPVCNFADYCITIGTAILLIYIMFFHKDDKNQEQIL